MIENPILPEFPREPGSDMFLMPPADADELPFMYEVVEAVCISCPICYEEKGEFSTLRCGDSYCSNCLQLMLMNLVDSNTLLPAHRGCPQCNEPIPLKFFKHMLPEAYIDKYQKLVNCARLSERVIKGEIVLCPAPRCKGFAVVFDHAELYSCKKCHTGVCPTCRKRFHPKISCEEAETMVYECDFLDLSVYKKWRQCPYCTVYTEKIDGCNHMTCYSMVCQGESGFCYLCGTGLNFLEDQYSHFVDSDSSGPPCKTIIGVPSEN